MKKLIVLVLCLFSISSFCQSADAVVDKYLQAMGGKAKWATIKSVKMTAVGKQQGLDLPIVALQKAPNKVKTTVSFQGKDIVFQAFDGKESWTTNFMNMKAEKGEAEDSENAAQELDFPDPFLDYASKGYSIALEGEETIEGTACHKIKLTKKPMKVEGKETENSSFYFFDKDSGALIMQRTVMKKGQAKGMTMETYMSDYQEVDGLFFPFGVSQKANGQEVFSMQAKKVELNVEIDDKEFSFPESK